MGLDERSRTPGLLREIYWILGCTLVLVPLFWNGEYGLEPVPFFAMVLYLVVWIPRLIVRWIRRQQHGRG